jgi:hypothetical protein
MGMDSGSLTGVVGDSKDKTRQDYRRLNKARLQSEDKTKKKW